MLFLKTKMSIHGKASARNSRTLQEVRFISNISTGSVCTCIPSLEIQLFFEITKPRNQEFQRNLLCDLRYFAAKSQLLQSSAGARSLPSFTHEAQPGPQHFEIYYYVYLRMSTHRLLNQTILGFGLPLFAEVPSGVETIAILPAQLQDRL